MKSQLDGMKILYLDLFFELPEDFQGDLNDALLALVEYRKSKNEHTCEPGDLTQTGDEWLDFLNARTHGFKIVGKVGMAKYNEEAEDWEEIEDGSTELEEQSEGQ